MIYSETTAALSEGEEATNRNILGSTSSQTNSRVVDSVTDSDDMKVTTMTYSGETARKMFQIIFNTIIK